MRLNKHGSVLFVLVYGVTTLMGRFWMESAHHIGVAASLLLGLLCLGLLLLLFKVGFLTLKG